MLRGRRAAHARPGRGYRARLALPISGIPGPIEVAGVGDAVLHACFATALAALWVYPSVGQWAEEIEVNLAFSLAAARTSENPSDLVEAGEVNGAVTIWSELLSFCVRRIARSTAAGLTRASCMR